MKDLETGNVAYIPIMTYIPMVISEQDSRRIYGGRCIWIEKDKLFEIINGG